MSSRYKSAGDNLENHFKAQFEPADATWTNRFKSRLKGARVRKYWRILLKHYPEQHYLDLVHDLCGPNSLVLRIRAVHLLQGAREERLRFACADLKGCIRTIGRIESSLQSISFRQLEGEGKSISMLRPRTLDIQFPKLLSELGASLSILEKLREDLAAGRRQAAPAGKLTKNFSLTMLFEFLVDTVGVPHWPEISEIVNAARFAHGLEERITESSAQRLWSRDRPNRRAKESDNRIR